MIERSDNAAPRRCGGRPAGRPGRRAPTVGWVTGTVPGHAVLARGSPSPATGITTVEHLARLAVEALLA